MLDKASVLQSDFLQLLLNLSRCRRSHVSNSLLENNLVVLHGRNCLFNPLKILLLVNFPSADSPSRHNLLPTRENGAPIRCLTS